MTWGLGDMVRIVGVTVSTAQGSCDFGVWVRVLVLELELEREQILGPCRSISCVMNEVLTRLLAGLRLSCLKVACWMG